MIIAVDFDHTLSLNAHYPYIGEPRLGFDSRKIVADYYIDDRAVHVHDMTKIKSILYNSMLRHNDCQG